MNIKERQGIVLILVISFLVYVIAGLFGYGVDFDIYGMIKTGREVVTHFEYHPLRNYEGLITTCVIGAASLLGGFYLSNLISAALGSATLLLFFALLRKTFDVTTAFLIALIVGLNPYFIIAASSSNDNIYNLFFILLGTYALYHKRFVIAAVMLSLAINSRIETGPTVGAIYLYFLVTSFRHDKRVAARFFLSGCLALLFMVILFLPNLIRFHGFFLYGLSSPGESVVFWHTSRLIYKNIYFWGLLAFLFLLPTTVYGIARANRAWFFRQPSVVCGLIIVLLEECIYFVNPTVKFHLIPISFIGVPIWAFLTNSRKLLVILLILIVSYNAISLDILDIKYNAKGSEAIGAHVGLFVRYGALINDLMWRSERQRLCWQWAGLPPEECGHPH